MIIMVLSGNNPENGKKTMKILHFRNIPVQLSV